MGGIMWRVKLSSTKYLKKTGPTSYALISATADGRQQINLRTTEAIEMLQAIMQDFGRKMPTGIKVIMKIAEAEEVGNGKR
jgi:hypothetical protein